MHFFRIWRFAFFGTIILLSQSGSGASAQGGYGKKAGATSQKKAEEKIVARIWALPEVKQRDAYVRQQSHGSRKLAVAIYEQPTRARPWYWVKVWEDNGSAYVSHFNFYVKPGGGTIKYLDTETDALYDLAAWRKKYRK